jgi:hypothetical protein
VTVANLPRLVRFRENEVLRGCVDSLQGPFAFRCECAEGLCEEFVLVERDAVGEVRPNPRRLVMAIGHASEDERIVQQYDGYVVVELV